MPKATVQDLEEIEAEIEDTEAEKAARKAERAERKRQKALAKKKEFQEKLVAPILLAITILISVIVIIFNQTQ